MSELASETRIHVGGDQPYEVVVGTGVLGELPGLVGKRAETVAVIYDERLAPLAPEGTRRRVEKWKTGFWKMARAANVPVLPVYFHYPDRVIGIGPLWRMSDDLDADMARIRAWYAPWQGKNRGTL